MPPESGFAPHLGSPGRNGEKNGENEFRQTVANEGLTGGGGESANGGKIGGGGEFGSPSQTLKLVANGEKIASC